MSKIQEVKNGLALSPPCAAVEHRREMARCGGCFRVMCTCEHPATPDVRRIESSRYSAGHIASAQSSSYEAGAAAGRPAGSGGFSLLHNESRADCEVFAIPHATRLQSENPGPPSIAGASGGGRGLQRDEELIGEGGDSMLHELSLGMSNSVGSPERDREMLLLRRVVRIQDELRRAYTAIASTSTSPQKQLQQEQELDKLRMSASRSGAHAQQLKGVLQRKMLDVSKVLQAKKPSRLYLSFCAWMDQAQDRRRRGFESKELYLVVELVNEPPQDLKERKIVRLTRTSLARMLIELVSLAFYSSVDKARRRRRSRVVRRIEDLLTAQLLSAAFKGWLEKHQRHQPETGAQMVCAVCARSMTAEREPNEVDSGDDARRWAQLEIQAQLEQSPQQKRQAMKAMKKYSEELHHSCNELEQRRERASMHTAHSHESRQVARRRLALYFALKCLNGVQLLMFFSLILCLSFGEPDYCGLCRRSISIDAKHQAGRCWCAGHFSNLFSRAFTHV